MLLWGLFDNELYAEFNGERFGPYYPVSGPIAALAGNDVRLTPSTASVELPRIPFNAEAHESHFPSAIAAKLAIADELAQPLSKLSTEDQAFIHQMLSETLTRRVALERIRTYFRHKRAGEEHAG